MLYLDSRYLSQIKPKTSRAEGSMRRNGPHGDGINVNLFIAAMMGIGGKNHA